jgi:hypothetical protein
MTWPMRACRQGALGMSGGQWAAEWHTTKSSKCLHLHRRLVEIGAAPPQCPNEDGELQARARSVTLSLHAFVFLPCFL